MVKSTAQIISSIGNIGSVTPISDVISGGKEICTFQVPITIPAGLPAGTYAYSVYAYDAVRNMMGDAPALQDPANFFTVTTP